MEKYFPQFELKRKRALITGLTQGIGAALAKGLGKAGASIIINARTEQKLDNCLREIRELGIEVDGLLI